MRTAGPPGRTRTPLAQRRSGSAAAELAILLPFVALLTAVAVDFCRAYYHAQVVQACAEAGALYASETARRNPNTTTDDSNAAVQAALAAGASLQPPLTDANVSVRLGGGMATVTVTYQLPAITSVPGMPNAFTIQRSVQMVLVPAVGQ